MHESFLRHERWRYLKAATALCVLSIAIYLWHDPLDGPNGGTWLGYALGTLGALIIVWLSWLGVRKRQYASNLGSVRGWVSAHVYFGVALLVVASLHTGFQFGWNLHTLAYALMVLVIVSGIVGIVLYARYPRMITDHRSQATREAWLEEVLDINERAIQVADQVGPEVHELVLRGTEQVQLGGGWRAQLAGSRGDGGAGEMRALTEVLRKRLTATGAERAAAPGTEAVILLTDDKIMTRERDPAVERLKQLLELLTRRNDLADRVNRDVRMHARLQIWLYVHVPLTGALLAALTAHVIVVFLYW